MCWLGVLPTTGFAQKIVYDAVTHDSVALFAFETVALQTGDTALVLPYRTFLPPGDTVAARSGGARLVARRLRAREDLRISLRPDNGNLGSYAD
jgi:hypothetical protein